MCWAFLFILILINFEGINPECPEIINAKETILPYQSVCCVYLSVLIFINF